MEDHRNDLRRVDDAVVAELIRQMADNSRLISKVLEKQEEADKRQDNEDVAHTKIWEKLDEMSQFVTMPYEKHAEDHIFIEALYEEIIEKRKREQARKEFWKKAASNIVSDSLIRMLSIIALGLVTLFWEEIVDVLSRIFGKGP